MEVNKEGCPYLCGFPGVPGGPLQVQDAGLDALLTFSWSRLILSQAVGT